MAVIADIAVISIAQTLEHSHALAAAICVASSPPPAGQTSHIILCVRLEGDRKGKEIHIRLRA